MLLAFMVGPQSWRSRRHDSPANHILALGRHKTELANRAPEARGSKHRPALSSEGLRRVKSRIQAPALSMRLMLLLLACVAQYGGTASAASAASVASAGAAELRVSYQEVRSASVARAAVLLRRLATRERSTLQRSCGATGSSAVRILQELGRPERWVRLEWTCEASNLGAQPATAGFSALEALQVAPVQVLLHHRLAGVTGTQHAAWAALDVASKVVYEVTHVDIGGPGVSLSDVDDAIRRYISAARAAPGNLRAEAWRLDGHANHSTLLFVWNTRADRERFAAGADAHRFRGRIAPGLGAPYDDRLYRRID